MKVSVKLFVSAWTVLELIDRITVNPEVAFGKPVIRVLVLRFS